jgi:hypothetical protein
MAGVGDDNGAPGVSIDDFLVLKYKEFFRWCSQEVVKAGLEVVDVQKDLPKYWEAIMNEVEKAAEEAGGGSYKGVEDGLERARKFFVRAVERLKEIRRHPI